MASISPARRGSRGEHFFFFSNFREEREINPSRRKFNELNTISHIDDMLGPMQTNKLFASSEKDTVLLLLSCSSLKHNNIIIIRRRWP